MSGIGERVAVNQAHRSGSQRLLEVDALRGMLMALMALDHAALIVAQKHPQAEMWGGPLPVYTDGLSFWTRFVTHLCAPGFALLMGAGMALLAHSRQRAGWSRARIARHLALRGAILIVLQLAWANALWSLMPGGWGIGVYIGVLAALGGSMVLGAGLLWIGPRWLLAMGLALLVACNLLVPHANQWGAGQNAIRLVLLITGGILSPNGRLLLWSNYPVLPWLGVVLAGIALGKALVADTGKTLRRVWLVGVAMLGAFVCLRTLNGFGNIQPRQGESLYAWLTLVKYPPSLSFVLLTIGLDLVLLSLMSRAVSRGWCYLNPLAVWGRVPLFFYCLHIPLYLIMAYLWAPHGMPLWMAYPCWLLGLAMLYPTCRWFGRLRKGLPLNSLLRLL